MRGPRADVRRDRGEALRLAPLFLLAALAAVACSRATAPPRADETCAKLHALYDREHLPFEANECIRMVGALPADDAACFDRCTASATVKALVACQTECRGGAAR